MQPVSIEGFDYEVDAYSMFGGEPTDDFELAGGSVIVRATSGHGVDAVHATVSVAAASLPAALGHAVAVLLREDPEPGVRRLSITGYVDGEAGHLMVVDREVGTGEDPAAVAH